MTILVSAPSVSRPPGTYNLPSTLVGETAQRIEIAIGRAGLPAGPVANFQFELSMDGGATWNLLGRSSLIGGVVLDRSGAVATETMTSVSRGSRGFLPTDRVRATVEVLQTVTTSIVVRTA